MASNEVPRSQSLRLTLAEDFADGAHGHPEVGLLHNTEERVRADIATLRLAEHIFQTSRSDRKALSTAQTLADANGRAFIGKARKVIALRLGDRWSAAWLPTGFPDQSTAVPETIAKRQDLLAKLRDFFAGHASFEFTDPDHAENSVTAARAAVAEKDTDLGKKKAARDAADDALTTRLSSGIRELGDLLPANDPRWHAFGLNLPSDPDQPDAVEGLALTATGPGAAFATWHPARRAEHYRVLLMIVGVDADYRQVAERDECDAALADLPARALVRVKIVAMNEAADGPDSAVVEIPMP